MLSLNRLSFSFGMQLLFEDVCLNLENSSRYGLVGANGSGKTTFFKILSGEISPSSGEIIKPKSFVVGVLKQEYSHLDKEKIVDVVIMGKTRLYEALKKKDAILEKEELSDEDIELLGHCEEVIEKNDGYLAESAAEELLEGLGFDKEACQKPMGAYSGGYKMRVLLAQLLFIQPDILLLDEPTNYLDIISIAWLEGYLKNFSGITLICSHDRYFLNQVCTKILDIDYGKILCYTGNYDDFLEQKEQDAELKQSSVENLEKKQKHLQNFIDRFGAKASKAKQASSKQKNVDKLEEEKKEHFLRASTRIFPSFRFPITGKVPAIPLVVDEVRKSFKDNLVLDHVCFELQRNDKIAIVGANGVGKSTLLEILTGNLEPDKATFAWKDSVKIAYFPQHFERLLDFKFTVLQMMEEKYPEHTQQKLRAVLGAMLFDQDEMEKKVKDLSGGEKARLVFAILMLQEQNVLILDEPTNHLDLESCEALIEALQNYEGSLILVSHNRYFLSKVGTRILELRKDGYFNFLGTYDEYVEKRGVDYFDRNVISAKKEKKPFEKSKSEDSSDHKKETKKIESLCQKLEEELNKIMDLISKEDFYLKFSEEKRLEFFQKKKELENSLEETYKKWESLLDR